LTLAEAEHAVREAYTQHANILNDERDRVLISLARRREYRVLVVRQETSSELAAGTQPGTLNIGASKRGTAKVVRLPAYENDVLHALAKAEGGADGLPGLDAENTVYIVRRKRFDPALSPEPAPSTGSPHPGADDSHAPLPRENAPRTFDSSPPSHAPMPDVPPAQSDSSLEFQQRADIIRGPNHRSESTTVPLPAAPPTQQQAPEPPPADTPTDGLAPEVPLWPRPAEPADSVKRTSAEELPLWGHASPSVVRGQSPESPMMGHSGFGQPVPSPYGRITRGSLPMMAPEPGWKFGGHVQSWQSRLVGFDPTIDNPNVVKIPVRLGEGQVPTFTEQDIILHDGDIVFIESRETEVFYTGGLLGGGQYTLPRDYDLGVLEAISIAQSPQTIQNQTTRSIGGISALNMDVTFSASHVVILRKLANGTRMPIKVDLYKALRRPETENILIQPGDLIILQYTKMEAIGAFLERHLLEGALFGIAAAQFNNNGSGF